MAVILRVVNLARLEVYFQHNAPMATGQIRLLNKAFPDYNFHCWGLSAKTGDRLVAVGRPSQELTSRDADARHDPLSRRRDP
jgi:hypothetical protein